MIAGATLFHLSAVQGATITVFSPADSGAGTLRQAIFDASSGDTINFDINFTTPLREIDLTSGELLINKNLTINGPGADKLAVQVSFTGGVCPVDLFRAFRIAPATVTASIFGLTVAGPTNTCAAGGGIFNAGTLTIGKSSIVSNSTRDTPGGGIANEGSLTITDSTVSGNISFFSYGGGINNSGVLLISNSTISGNRAGANGGGIANLIDGAVLTIANGTVSGNHAGTDDCGGGLVTVTGNSCAVQSTIIAQNDAVSGPDVCGPLVSQNFNLIGDNGGATITPQSFDQIGTPAAPIGALLGPLQYNGGTTFTQALQSNSPAVNGGDPNSSSRDQRGYLRAGVSDIGAFEYGGTVPVSLGNISTRLRVETGNDVLIGGFIITGAQPKRVLVRAIGPSLPLPGALANPILELRDSSGGLIAINDNWRTDQEGEIIATTIPPSNDLESAIVATVPANGSAYTAIVRGANNGTGIGLVEAYDISATVDSKLGNISTRGLVQAGDNVLIGGLIVRGQDSIRVMARAIGPSLPVPGTLGDPTLELYNGDGAIIASNDNWRTDQEAEIIATGIPPSNDVESAVVLNLAPGSYTAIVRGVNDATGVALVEVYELESSLDQSAQSKPR